MKRKNFQAANAARVSSENKIAVTPPVCSGCTFTFAHEKGTCVRDRKSGSLEYRYPSGH